MSDLYVLVKTRQLSKSDMKFVKNWGIHYFRKNREKPRFLKNSEKNRITSQ